MSQNMPPDCLHRVQSVENSLGLPWLALPSWPSLQALLCQGLGHRRRGPSSGARWPLPGPQDGLGVEGLVEMKQEGVVSASGEGSI